MIGLRSIPLITAILELVHHAYQLENFFLYMYLDIEYAKALPVITFKIYNNERACSKLRRLWKFFHTKVSYD